MVTEAEEVLPLTQEEIRQWHRFANPIVHEFYGGRCTACRRYTPPWFGVVHHRSYDRAYPFSRAEVIFLCRQGKLEWSCYPCHNKAHRRRS